MAAGLPDRLTVCLPPTRAPSITFDYRLPWHLPKTLMSSENVSNSSCPRYPLKVKVLRQMIGSRLLETTRRLAAGWTRCSGYEAEHLLRRSSRLRLSDFGIQRSFSLNPGIACGLNVARGRLVQPLAESNLPELFMPPK